LSRARVEELRQCVELLGDGAPRREERQLVRCQRRHRRGFRHAVRSPDARAGHDDDFAFPTFRRRLLLSEGMVGSERRDGGRHGQAERILTFAP
jgi:hypothetical protein